MADRVPMLLKIFRVELEEAEKNVLELVDHYSKRFNNHEITSYVWMENRALLQKELSCLTELERDLSSWDSGGRTDPEGVLEDLKIHLKNLVRTRGYPELVGLVIDRIGNKISRYLE